jgi:hypothetical protein
MRIKFSCMALPSIPHHNILTSMAHRDDIGAEVTALAMGWKRLNFEDGITIWVRSEEIGVNDVPYCDTALEVVLAYTH